MSKNQRKPKVLKARSDAGSRKRQGCGFTNNDLTNAVNATGFSRTAVEKDIKDAFRKATPGGAPVIVYSNVYVKKGPRGKTAKLIIS